MSEHGTEPIGSVIKTVKVACSGTATNRMSLRILEILDSEDYAP